MITRYKPGPDFPPKLVSKDGRFMALDEHGPYVIEWDGARAWFVHDNHRDECSHTKDRLDGHCQAPDAWIAEVIQDGPRALPDLGGYTPADLLGIIVEAVSRLPHALDGSPALELGPSEEAHALVRRLGEGTEGFEVDDQGYACVRIGGLWVGASRPKTEVR